MTQDGTGAAPRPLLDIRRSCLEPEARQGAKAVPDQVDPSAWVYDVGENSDPRPLDVRTDRIAAIDDFVAAGYEVHVNLSPVVVRDGWRADWSALLDHLAAGTGVAFEVTDLIADRTPWLRVRYAF